MPKLKPTDSELRNRETRAVLADAQTREDMSDEEVAKRLNISRTTYQSKRRNPGGFKLSEIRSFAKLMKLTDEEIVRLVKGERK